MVRKRLAILGAGESGIGAAILGVKEGFDVLVSDNGTIKDEYKRVLKQRKIIWEENKHSKSLILKSDLVVISPGIPDDVEIVKELAIKGVPVISEIEFAGRYTEATTVCITGSNGKTTTTMLTYEMLKMGGMNVGIAGNIGQSFAWQVAENDYDVFVIELSSFQLDRMYGFRADIAVILNITPDHLDRYGYDMQKYTDSKFRILQNQLAGDSFIYCADDPVIIEEIEKREIVPKKLPFSLKNRVEEGAWLESEIIRIEINNKSLSMSIHELALKGKHNIYNSMAAGISAQVLKLRKEDIRQCLTDFHGVEHRLERFLKVHGIEFINDSKATNINSTWYALESMENKVVWIAGGVDKGNDYSVLHDLAREKVKALVCLGKDNSKISSAFKGIVNEIVEANNMEEAVRNSYFLADKGDIVLLSPACASFDLFDNYEERGRLFKEAVRNL